MERLDFSHTKTNLSGGLGAKHESVQTMRQLHTCGSIARSRNLATGTKTDDVHERQTNHGQQKSYCM